MRRWIGTVAPIVAAWLLAGGCQVDPVTGQKQFNLLSSDQEIRMGHGLHPDIIFMYDGEYQDPELKRYLGTIVMRLHRVSHRSDLPVDFTVLNSSVINAFAIPGHVYATRGFLAELENEAQFAAVMGHELAHVACGHSALVLSRQQAMAVGLGALGVLLDEDHPSRPWILAGTQVGVTLLGLSYSRQHEHQADRVGTYYMALAGWDPRESISMQRLLGSFGSHSTTFLDKYLSTHPPMDERIADIEAVIQEKGLLTGPWIQGDGIYAERWRRHLAGLRADQPAFAQYDRGTKALADRDPDTALAAAEKAIALDATRAPFHRLRADALAAVGRLDEARTAYRRSLELDRRYVPAQVGLGDLALRQDRLAEAEDLYRRALHGHPSNLQAQFGLGVSLLRQDRPREAVAPLERVAQATTSGPVWFLLATAYDRSGQRPEAALAYQQALQSGLDAEQSAQAESRLAALQSALATTSQ